MATNSIEEQPIQATENEHMELSPEDKRPEEKSHVGIDVNALMSASKFKTGDTVHMSLNNRGTRTKGVFTIKKRRGNPKGYVEYQITNVKTGQPHEGGAWIRERELSEGS
jgi:hypothetical protein